jgi:hypothetical protein
VLVRRYAVVSDMVLDCIWIPGEDRHRLVAGNAAALYGFD